MQNLEAILAEHPFFKGIDPGYLKILASCAMAVEFNSGQLIFQEGEMANRFYLIQSGKVVLESHAKDGGLLLIQELGAGEVLGWSWLFAPYYWHFDARVVEPASAIFFYGTRLREECETNHHFGYELMKRVSEVVIERLQVTRARLLKAEGLQ